MTYAFKCLNCGRLERAEQAGYGTHPHACSVCSWGVRFDPISGVKSPMKENWLVLADLNEAELTELGLTPDMVSRHVPASSTPRVARHITAEAFDGAGAGDRQ